MNYEETSNYIKVVLLIINGGTFILKKNVHKIVHGSGRSLESFLSQCEETLKQKLKTNKKQIELVFPQDFQPIDIDKWDISLLSLILIEVFQGFFESEKELDLIKLIRDQRNKLIGHRTETEMKPREFLSVWNLISHALDNIATSLSDEVQQDLKEIETSIYKSSFKRGLIEQVAEIEDSESFTDAVKDKIMPVVAEIKSESDRLKRELLRKVSALEKESTEQNERPMKLQTKIDISARICVKAENLQVRKSIQRTILEASKHLISKDTDSGNVKDDIESAVTEIFTGIEDQDVEIINSELGSILLTIRCPTVESTFVLIHFLQGTQIQNLLLRLETAVCEKYSCNAKITIDVDLDSLEMAITALEKVMYIDSVDLTLRCKGTTGVKKAIEYFESSDSLNKLNNLSEIISGKFGEKVQIQVEYDVCKLHERSSQGEASHIDTKNISEGMWRTQKKHEDHVKQIEVSEKDCNREKEEMEALEKLDNPVKDEREILGATSHIDTENISKGMWHTQKKHEDQVKQIEVSEKGCNRKKEEMEALILRLIKEFEDEEKAWNLIKEREALEKLDNPVKDEREILGEASHIDTKNISEGMWRTQKKHEDHFKQLKESILRLIKEFEDEEKEEIEELEKDYNREKEEMKEMVELYNREKEERETTSVWKLRQRNPLENRSAYAKQRRLRLRKELEDQEKAWNLIKEREALRATSHIDTENISEGMWHTQKKHEDQVKQIEVSEKDCNREKEEMEALEKLDNPVKDEREILGEASHIDTENISEGMWRTQKKHEDHLKQLKESNLRPRKLLKDEVKAWNLIKEREPLGATSHIDTEYISEGMWHTQKKHEDHVKQIEVSEKYCNREKEEMEALEKNYKQIKDAMETLKLPQKELLEDLENNYKLVKANMETWGKLDYQEKEKRETKREKEENRKKEEMAALDVVSRRRTEFFAAGVGFIFGSAFGPVGALCGVITGAAVGYLIKKMHE